MTTNTVAHAEQPSNDSSASAADPQPPAFDFLGLRGEPVLVCGLANRKSIAWHVGKLLTEAGADVLWTVRTEARKEQTAKLTKGQPVYVCDVESQEQIDALAERVQSDRGRLRGLVHSIAFADYSAGWKPFHETPRAAFLQAVDISCYSLLALSQALQRSLDRERGSVVAVSISTTTMAAENYGYMAPIKAALDSSIAFLAKSFSKAGKVRFNAVCPGLLKTSASAGIPGYVDSYLFAENATLRRQAVQTAEVADAVAYLLSHRSSAINAQRLVLDAGMGTNYFDERLVEAAVSNLDAG